MLNAQPDSASSARVGKIQPPSAEQIVILSKNLASDSEKNNPLISRNNELSAHETKTVSQESEGTTFRRQIKQSYLNIVEDHPS